MHAATATAPLRPAPSNPLAEGGSVNEGALADVHTFCLEQDNSEREWYADAFAAVPDHWLKYEDYVNTGEFPIDILINMHTRTAPEINAQRWIRCGLSRPVRPCGLRQSASPICALLSICTPCPRATLDIV